jgi:fibronectin-binding autotransporter adhesin
MRAIHMPVIKVASPHRTKQDLKQRGVAMVTVLFLMGLMLVVSVALLQGASSTATNTTHDQQKNQVFDAAETGLDAALNALDQTSTTASGTCTSGSLQPYGTSSTTFSYESCVGYNNFTGASTATGVTDPATGSANISVPGGTAFVYGYATSSLTGEKTYVEAIVKAASNSLTLPAGALDAAGNGTFSGTLTLNANNPPTNNDAAAIANGNITGAGTLAVQGPVDTHGTVTYAGTLTDTATNQNTSVASFPTAAQVNSFASSAQTTAQSGTTYTSASFLSTCANASACTGNIYVNGNITQSGTTTVTINGTGTVYINGNITFAGTLNFINKNGATVIINGNVTGAGSFNYSVTPGVTTATLTVLGTGGFTLSGAGQSVGIVYAPFGSITMAGSSGVTGQVAAGDADTCDYSNGCGNVTNSGNFLINYVSGLQYPSSGPSFVTILSYIEH